MSKGVVFVFCHVFSNFCTKIELVHGNLGYLAPILAKTWPKTMVLRFFGAYLGEKSRTSSLLMQKLPKTCQNEETSLASYLIHEVLSSNPIVVLTRFARKRLKQNLSHCLIVSGTQGRFDIKAGIAEETGHKLSVHRQAQSVALAAEVSAQC